MMRHNRVENPEHKVDAYIAIECADSFELIQTLQLYLT